MHLFNYLCFTVLQTISMTTDKIITRKRNAKSSRVQKVDPQNNPPNT